MADGDERMNSPLTAAARRLVGSRGMDRVQSIQSDGLGQIQDFARYPELRWLNRYHLVPPATLAVALFAAGGWPLFVWGTINSLSHVFGSRRYPTNDESRNNWLLALITFGEGWHNHHHHFMSTANQGFFWWEIDLTYYGMRVLEKLGLFWGLRVPPPHVTALPPTITLESEQ